MSPRQHGLPVPVSAAAAVAHPLARSHATRPLEAALAPVAASDPRARRAAAAALTAVVALFDLVDPTHPPLADLLGSWLGEGPERRPRYSQTGDVHPDDVEAVVKEGNLRERMTLLSNSQAAMNQALYRAGTRAATDRVFAAQLDDLGFDRASIVARAAALRPEDAGTFLNAEGPIAASRQGVMRRPRVEVMDERIEALTNRRSDHPFTPPLSPRERAHIAAWRRRTAGDQENVPPAGDDNHARLPHADGKHVFKARRADPWHAASATRQMHTAVSISGTAYRLMRMARYLDADPTHAVHFRTALLGHMVPYHHTYHEVMSASADLGMAYDATPTGLVAHARQLAAAVNDRAPAARGASKRLEALAVETGGYLATLRDG